MGILGEIKEWFISVFINLIGLLGLMSMGAIAFYYHRIRDFLKSRKNFNLPNISESALIIGVFIVFLIIAQFLSWQKLFESNAFLKAENKQLKFDKLSYVEILGDQHEKLNLEVGNPISFRIHIKNNNPSIKYQLFYNIDVYSQVPFEFTGFKERLFEEKLWQDFENDIKKYLNPLTIDMPRSDNYQKTLIDAKPLTKDNFDIYNGGNDSAIFILGEILYFDEYGNKATTPFCSYHRVEMADDYFFPCQQHNAPFRS